MRHYVWFSSLLLALSFGITQPLSCFAQQSWGTNSNGQLGNTATSTSSAVTNPVSLDGITGATNITAGTAHGLALKGDGTVWSWGYNRYGALGRTLKIG